MKNLLIIFSLLLTSGSWCDLTEINYISLPNKLESYKWKKRILLLIDKEEDTVLVNEVNNFFITHKCKNDERNLELIKLKKGNNIKILKYDNLREWCEPFCLHHSF